MYLKNLGIKNLQILMKKLYVPQFCETKKKTSKLLQGDWSKSNTNSVNSQKTLS